MLGRPLQGLERTVEVLGRPLQGLERTVTTRPGVVITRYDLSQIDT